MVVYYRWSGVLAVSALTLYVLFTLAGLAAFGFTLTLPGLAGLVLSVGIAVDANVLIFERIREELQHGKLVRTAVDEGFTHAMSAIIDSNVSTALTAFILYLVGTGPVHGFAITLIICIAGSMVAGILVAYAVGRDGHQGRGDERGYGRRRGLRARPRPRSGSVQRRTHRGGGP